jgi:hypothetical protein
MPALDAVKIEARAVIAIVRALERGIGKRRAHCIIGPAIAGVGGVDVLARSFETSTAKPTPERNVGRSAPRRLQGAVRLFANPVALTQN